MNKEKLKQIGLLYFRHLIRQPADGVGCGEMKDKKTSRSTALRWSIRWMLLRPFLVGFLAMAYKREMLFGCFHLRCIQMAVLPQSEDIGVQPQSN